ncbi:MAG TPA: biotin--[acetyl-CoA-carboxylase] ligase, partial [Flavobacteriales bacterium]|nr:biotin--[acetyl-CoA-carboxylase] ligase [Flavobacteriales bacterium]
SQGSNKWDSENGKNVLMSVAINTDIKIENQFILNVISSLSVLDLLEDLNLENLSVKWPNDILVGKRKISGILIQNKLLSNTIKSTVIGIGLNINQSKFTSFKREATSVKNENITDLSVSGISDRLLEFLEFRFSKSDNENWKDYFEKLYLRDKLAPFEIEGKRQMGIIRKVNKTGELVLEIEDSIKNFQMKEIEFLI